jgi:hypothetical protein
LPFKVVILVVLIAPLAAAGSARAQACPPAARLSGEAKVVDALAGELDQRGIATHAADCPAIAVAVQRRGDSLVVSTAGGGHRDGNDDGDGNADGDGNGDRARPVERVVTDVRTAATVIESWVRTDVEAPLLAARDITLPPAAAAAAPPRASMPPLPATLAATAPPSSARGVQLFAIGETSRAIDGTSWLGVQVGACVTLGRACAAARARFAGVAAGPARWQAGLERHGVEVLLGADVPVHFGRATLSPGFAGGVGWTHTHLEGTPRDGETGGLRADFHVALSLPVHARVALELALSFEVTQATHVETSSAEPLPDEPRLFGRLGVGVRFGGL